MTRRKAPSSRTSSSPPSADAPKTRQQRPAEARTKAKELLKKDGEKRKAGGQPGHRAAGERCCLTIMVAGLPHRATPTQAPLPPAAQVDDLRRANSNVSGSNSPKALAGLLIGRERTRSS